MTTVAQNYFAAQKAWNNPDGVAKNKINWVVWNASNIKDINNPPPSQMNTYMLVTELASKLGMTPTEAVLAANELAGNTGSTELGPKTLAILLGAPANNVGVVSNAMNGNGEKMPDFADKTAEAFQALNGIPLFGGPELAAPSGSTGGTVGSDSGTIGGGAGVGGADSYWDPGNVGAGGSYGTGYVDSGTAPSSPTAVNPEAFRPKPEVLKAKLDSIDFGTITDFSAFLAMITKLSNRPLAISPTPVRKEDIDGAIGKNAPVGTEKVTPDSRPSIPADGKVSLLADVVTVDGNSKWLSLADDVNAADVMADPRAAAEGLLSNLLTVQDYFAFMSARVSSGIAA